MSSPHDDRGNRCTGARACHPRDAAADDTVGLTGSSDSWSPRDSRSRAGGARTIRAFVLAGAPLATWWLRRAPSSRSLTLPVLPAVACLHVGTRPGERQRSHLGVAALAQAESAIFGSSWIAGESCADVKEEIFLVAVSVSAALDDLEGGVDAFNDAGVKRGSAAGPDAVPIALQALCK